MNDSEFALTYEYRRRLLMIIGAVLAIPVSAFCILSVFRVMIFGQSQAAEDIAFSFIVSSAGLVCYLLAREHHEFMAGVIIVAVLGGVGIADLIMDQTPVTELGPSLVFLLAIVLASVVLPPPWSWAISFVLWTMFIGSIILWAFGFIGSEHHYRDMEIAIMGVFLFTLTILFLVISSRVAIRDLLSQVRDVGQAQLKLEEERVLAHAIFDTAHVIILILDEDANIVRYNRYLEELTGRRLADFKGLNWYDSFLPKRDHVEIKKLFENAIKFDHGSVGNVNPILTIEGIEISVEWHDSLINYKYGQPCLLAIGVDVTERTRILKERQRLADMQMQFMQNTSHEMRTPLGLILGYAEMMKDGGFGEVGAGKLKALDIIIRRARELRNLVGDIVVMLELEDRRVSGLQVDREPIALGDMASQLLNDYAVMADAMSIKLVENVGEVFIMGSPKMITRAIDNVLRNALKFSVEGGEIRLVVGIDEGCAVLEVADTGVGIDKKALPFVFERFYQANGTSSRRFEGSGLGLALVKEVIESHGGSVSLESVHGVGTTIRLLFPLGNAPGT